MMNDSRDKPTNNSSTVVEANFDNQDKMLSDRLVKDANKLDASVDNKLRVQLFNQLERQDSKKIYSIKSTSYPRYAIAASILLSLIATSVYLNQPASEDNQTTIAVLENTSISNPAKEMSNDLMILLSNERKLASLELQNEYQAILSDIDKVKKQIVTL